MQFQKDKSTTLCRALIKFFPRDMIENLGIDEWTAPCITEKLNT